MPVRLTGPADTGSLKKVRLPIIHRCDTMCHALGRGRAAHQPLELWILVQIQCAPASLPGPGIPQGGAYFLPRQRYSVNRICGDREAPPSNHFCLPSVPPKAHSPFSAPAGNAGGQRALEELFWVTAVLLAAGQSARVCSPIFQRSCIPCAASLCCGMCWKR